jgi:hypothetical protein
MPKAAVKRDKISTLIFLILPNAAVSQLDIATRLQALDAPSQWCELFVNSVGDYASQHFLKPLIGHCYRLFPKF